MLCRVWNNWKVIRAPECSRKSYSYSGSSLVPDKAVSTTAKAFFNPCDQRIEAQKDARLKNPSDKLDQRFPSDSRYEAEEATNSKLVLAAF